MHQRFRCGGKPGTAGAVERRIDIGEIEDVRPVHDRGAELDRLDRILAAMRDQRAAHEHDRRQPVEQPQFAHGIGDIDVGGRDRQFLARAQGYMQAGRRDRARDALTTVRMPGHDHAQQRREGRGQTAVRFHEQLLLAGMGRGRDDDRAAARHAHQPLQPRRVGGRRRDIQFQISRRHDVAAAQRREALRIDLRLRETDVEASQQRRDRAGDPAPARERTMRHPAVDQHHRQTPRRARQDQIGPQIGLDEQRKTRPPVIEEARDIARRIERHILMDDVGRKAIGDDRRRSHRP